MVRKGVFMQHLDENMAKGEKPSHAVQDYYRTIVPIIKRGLPFSAALALIIRSKPIL
jgi:hypothetical protein